MAPYGHVAYVERVNKDGSIFISEMNWIAPYIVSTRTISASEVDSYTFTLKIERPCNDLA